MLIMFWTDTRRGFCFLGDERVTSNWVNGMSDLYVVALEYDYYSCSSGFFIHSGARSRARIPVVK